MKKLIVGMAVMLGFMFMAPLAQVDRKSVV